MVVGPKDIKRRFGQNPSGASEFHDVGALGRCNLGGDNADDLVELKGTMHDLSYLGVFGAQGVLGLHSVPSLVIRTLIGENNSEAKLTF